MPSTFVASMFVVSKLFAGTPDPSAVTSTTTPTNLTSSSATTATSDFETLKKAGDRALANGHLNDAIDAYQKAYDLRADPLIAGRIGLVFLMLDDPTLNVPAANALHRAVVAVAGTSQAERQQFFEAYTRVRRRVCKLEVKVSDAKATVDIGDGQPRSSRSAFWMFADPGPHELVAHLDGHEDIRKPYECSRGQDLAINIAFPAPNKPASEVVTIVRLAEPKTVVIREPIEPSIPPSRSDNALRAAAGVSALFGVAQSPAIGVTGIASYRWAFRSPWALSVDAGVLVGWTPVEIADAIDTFAFVMHGAACLHYRIVFGCPTVAVLTARYSFAAPEYATLGPSTTLYFGAGVRLGLEHFFWSRTGIRLHGDILNLGNSPSVHVRTIFSWRGTPIAGTIMLGIVRKF